MKSFVTILMLLLLCQLGMTQVNAGWRYHLSSNSYDTITGVITIAIDTILGDTAKRYVNSNRYTETTKDGVLIVDGHKRAGVCGCSSKPHGYWIERYRNGNLKEQGNYYCNTRVGTWIYYYENGQIAKLESLHKPYDSIIRTLGGKKGFVKEYNLREGPYLEYYPNGQLKIEGHYEIVEAYATIDTIYTFDPETYEKTPHLIEGEFWIPRSEKSGGWNYYDVNGNLIKKEDNRINTWRNDELRPLSERYQELFEEWAEYMIKAKAEKAKKDKERATKIKQAKD